MHTNWVGFHSSRSGHKRLRTNGDPRQVSHHVCKLIVTLCLASLIPTLNFSMNERPGGPRRNPYIDCYLHISCVYASILAVSLNVYGVHVQSNSNVLRRV